MSYINLGAERFFASAPTTDTERSIPFRSARDWTPDKIDIFGHQLTIDLPTGNLLISTDDISYPYYGFSLAITRKYDLQEQCMQRTYSREYPNVNPKPHWFGNWQFAYEADVDEVWQNTFSELHLTSGVGANGMFVMRTPDFKRNLLDATLVEKLLTTYGIPGRTLAELGWEFTKNDFVLRTLRGPFHILNGHYNDETLVDDINAKMWLFNPISGGAFLISSEYFFNIQADEHRDIGYPLIVTKLVDALGHSIELKPSVGMPPFKKYVLSDGSNRDFHVDLGEILTFPDGLNPVGDVRKYLVSKVTDATKASRNEFNYNYNSEWLLRTVIFPSTIGNHYTHYHYEDPNHADILTAIENFQGHKIQFEYVEDPTDNDDRLNPRLKIKKITDPEGITFEYEYDHVNTEVLVTVSKNGNTDSKVKYRYIQDIHDTKKRYITLKEIDVRRGYVADPMENVVSRQRNNPQIIRIRTEYTNDGRFNVREERDPLDRALCYKYNDFNQSEKIWDYDNHLTEYIYDIPNNPSPLNPIRYDVLSVKRENIIHIIDPTNPRNLIEKATVIKKDFDYDKYDNNNSPDNDDHHKQSTHRLFKEINERGKTWICTYDDPANYNSPSSTLIESPLGIKIKSTFNNRGERTTITDPEGNLHIYRYNDQGKLKEYIDPNQGRIKIFYYPCGNWLHKFEDQLTQITEIKRYADGGIKTIIDPVQDTVDYNYYKNGRLFKVTQHRPAIAGYLITGFNNLDTIFHYTPLGNTNYFENSKGLEMIFEFDEAGRIYDWYHQVANPKRIKFVYDAAGQLETLVDRMGNRTIYTHYNSGSIKTVRYPGWSDGVHNIHGKLVDYKKYDYFGRILSIVDSEILGTKEFLYDEAGNIIIRRDQDGFELYFDYDDDNRLKSVNDASNDYKLVLTSDDLGRPISVGDSAYLDGSVLKKYVYEKWIGPVKKVLNLYEESLSQIGLVSKYDYDEKNRLKTIEHEMNGVSPMSIYSQVVNYRDDDLIEEITGDDANSFVYDGTKQLIYEKTGRLVSNYDEAGNRLYRINKAVNINRTNNIYNELNQLKNDSELRAKFTYDENRNMLTSAYPIDTTEYYFDGANRLRRVKNSQYEIDYLYDYDGKLIERVVKYISTRNIERTTFHYLLTKPVLLKRNGNLFMLLTWDPSGKLLRVRRQQPVGASNYHNSLFPLYDRIGNIVRVVDGDGGVPIKISYDPWGEDQ